MKLVPPVLHPSPSRRHAARWVRRLVAEIGPGFHPDTDPADYVGEGRRRLFTPDVASEMAAALDRAEQVLGTERFEAIALNSIWRALRVRYDPAQESLVPLPTLSQLSRNR